MTQDDVVQAVTWARNWLKVTLGENDSPREVMINIVYEALLLRDAQLAIALEALDKSVGIERVFENNGMPLHPNNKWASKALEKIKQMETI